MKYHVTAKHILHQLGIGKSYSGYDYILYGINLIDRDTSCLNNITKILYIDIAKEFHTSRSCVERNIRKVIEVIWKHPNENQELILRIFGAKHIMQKPTNRIFFELLYEYITSYNQLEKFLTDSEPVICPISNGTCAAYHAIIEKLLQL